MFCVFLSKRGKYKTGSNFVISNEMFLQIKILEYIVIKFVICMLYILALIPLSLIVAALYEICIRRKFVGAKK